MSPGPRSDFPGTGSGIPADRTGGIDIDCDTPASVDLSPIVRGLFSRTCTPPGCALGLHERCCREHDRAAYSSLRGACESCDIFYST